MKKNAWDLGAGSDQYYYSMNPSLTPAPKEHIPTEEERKKSMRDLRGALKDIPRAFGRGLWGGATLATNVVGSELKGINNIVGGIPMWLDDMAKGTKFRYITAPVAAPYKLSRKLADSTMDQMAKWNGYVQDYYKYEHGDENTPALKFWNTLGHIPSVYYAARGVMGVPGAKRIFSPIQPKDVAAAAKFLPVNPVTKAIQAGVNWIAKPTLGASLYNLGTQAAVRAFPALDYATGITHINPDDSVGWRRFKNGLRAVPWLAALGNPAATLNFFGNHLPGRINALAEMTGRSAPLIASNLVDTRKGVLGHTIQGVKDTAKEHAPEAAVQLMKWWNDPSSLDPKTVAKAVIGVTNDMPTKVFNPWVDPKEKALAIREALDRAKRSAPLRYSGIQRTAESGLDWLNFSSPKDMSQAFWKGLNKTMDSADVYKNAIIGSMNREMYAAGKDMYDQVQHYRQLGDLKGANKVLRENIPVFAERFLNGNQEALKQIMDQIDRIEGYYDEWNKLKPYQRKAIIEAMKVGGNGLRWLWRTQQQPEQSPTIIDRVSELPPDPNTVQQGSDIVPRDN